MKRKTRAIVVAVLCCLMIFTSCAKTVRDVNNDEQVISKEPSAKDATGKDIPEWVKGSLGEGTLFEKVDIDGIGGADDEVYIITGRFDDYSSDYRNGLTVVYVHLGTGEVLAQAILCKGNYETHFANLIPGHGGNQIILEITDGNSTYLATNIFVIAVSVDEWRVGENDADVMRVPVISKLLDTTDYDKPVGGTGWREGISSDSISSGLEIVDIEGLEQQGLKICYLASKQDVAGQKAYETRTIYWNHGAWESHNQDGTEYVDVLQGNRQFCDATSGRYLYFSELKEVITPDDLPLNVQKFCLIDLTQSGRNDLVLQFSFAENQTAGFVVLHCQDDIVYSYTLSHRSMSELKGDGTFIFSGGASNWGIGKLILSKDGFSVDEISYCSDSSYFVDKVSTTREEFENEFAIQDAKENAEWFDFTAESVKTIGKEA